MIRGWKVGPRQPPPRPHPQTTAGREPPQNPRPVPDARSQRPRLRFSSHQKHEHAEEWGVWAGRGRRGPANGTYRTWGRAALRTRLPAIPRDVGAGMGDAEHLVRCWACDTGHVDTIPTRTPFSTDAQEALRAASDASRSRAVARRSFRITLGLCTACARKRATPNGARVAVSVQGTHGRTSGPRQPRAKMPPPGGAVSHTQPAIAAHQGTHTPGTARDTPRTVPAGEQGRAWEQLCPGTNAARPHPCRGEALPQRARRLRAAPSAKRTCSALWERKVCCATQRVGYRRWAAVHPPLWGREIDTHPPTTNHSPARSHRHNWQRRLPGGCLVVAAV